MERFLAVLEKTPRRGTALDRVYGYHVERGSLDAFLKAYRDKVAADPKDGDVLAAHRPRRGPARPRLGGGRGLDAGRSRPARTTRSPPITWARPSSSSASPTRRPRRSSGPWPGSPRRADLLDVYQALGRVHQRAHRNDKALAVWDRLEKAFPDDPRVQEQIAHALADESQDAAALARFEALAKGRPRTASAASSSPSRPPS